MEGGFFLGPRWTRHSQSAYMDARAQLEAERNCLEVELLTLEREWLFELRQRGDASVLSLQIDALFSSLELVNAQLAAIRHGDATRQGHARPAGG